ncbi:hypothetical protein PVK06_013736 [Gossypium arboreum]|uniref:RNase H type-1 domain-containing protein n=1 Tax=Gossypium arboreum TaxID=29729 RepID=A0ABR0PSS4_GOSAR|nr:hypothetical protein PVK06_013736 [Gossypium arboreum]
MGSGVVVNNHAADAFLAEALACLQALNFSIEMSFPEGDNGGGFKNNRSKDPKRDLR